MSAKYPKDLIADLVDGRLPWADTKRVMSDFKDTDRFATYISILQDRVGWEEPILMPIGEHLQVVKKPDGEPPSSEPFTTP